MPVQRTPVSDAGRIVSSKEQDPQENGSRLGVEVEFPVSSLQERRKGD